MVDCPCTITPTTTSIAVTSGNVTFDGGATCTGFNAGDVNDFIEHISDLVCALQASLAGLSIDPADISVTGLTVLPCINPALYADFNEYIDELAHIVCEVQTDLSTLVIADIGGTFDLSCINAGYGASTLQQAIDRLTVAVCAINGGQLTMNLLMSGGAMELPLMEFAKDAVVITDISALGVAKVSIDATDYWINATALSMIATNITPLVDSQDNYIFIDKDTQAYDWTAVAIGAAAPVTNGDKVAMVRTGVGTVTSITRLIGYSPIDSDILEDDSIDATKLTTTICTTPLENNGTNLILNYDNDDFDISVGNLILKTGCIANTGYFNMAGIAEPSIELSAGVKLQVATEDSVELDAVTGKVQLVNDSAAPGNNYMYATTSAGVKGWRLMPSVTNSYETDWIAIDSANILALNTTPIIVVAAQGANTFITIDEIHLWTAPGTPYVGNEIEFRYTNGAGAKVTNDVPDTFIQAAATQYYKCLGVGHVAEENKNVVMWTNTANPINGDAIVNVKVFYKVTDDGTV